MSTRRQRKRAARSEKSSAGKAAVEAKEMPDHDVHEERARDDDVGDGFPALDGGLELGQREVEFLERFSLQLLEILQDVDRAHVTRDLFDNAFHTAIESVDDEHLRDALSDHFVPHSNALWESYITALPVRMGKRHRENETAHAASEKKRKIIPDSYCLHSRGTCLAALEILKQHACCNEASVIQACKALYRALLLSSSCPASVVRPFCAFQIRSTPLLAAQDTIANVKLVQSVTRTRKNSSNRLTFHDMSGVSQLLKYLVRQLDHLAGIRSGESGRVYKKHASNALEATVHVLSQMYSSVEQHRNAADMAIKGSVELLKYIVRLMARHAPDDDEEIQALHSRLRGFLSMVERVCPGYHVRTAVDLSEDVSRMGRVSPRSRVVYGAVFGQHLLKAHRGNSTEMFIRFVIGVKCTTMLFAGASSFLREFRSSCSRIAVPSDIGNWISSLIHKEKRAWQHILGDDVPVEQLEEVLMNIEVSKAANEVSDTREEDSAPLFVVDTERRVERLGDIEAIDEMNSSLHSVDDEWGEEGDSGQAPEKEQDSSAEGEGDIMEEGDSDVEDDGFEAVDWNEEEEDSEESDDEPRRSKR